MPSMEYSQHKAAYFAFIFLVLFLNNVWGTAPKKDGAGKAIEEEAKKLKGEIEKGAEKAAEKEENEEAKNGIIDALKEAAEQIETAAKKAKEDLEKGGDEGTPEKVMETLKEEIKEAKGKVEEAIEKAENDETKEEVEKFVAKINAFEKHAVGQLGGKESKENEEDEKGGVDGKGQTAGKHMEKETGNGEVDAVLKDARTQFKDALAKRKPKMEEERKKALEKVKKMAKEGGNMMGEEVEKATKAMTALEEEGKQQMEDIEKTMGTRMESIGGVVEDELKEGKEILKKDKEHFQAELLKAMGMTEIMEAAGGAPINNNRDDGNGRPQRGEDTNNNNGPAPSSGGMATKEEVDRGENMEIQPKSDANCVDVDNDNCLSNIMLCKNKAYFRVMSEKCKQTCGHCVNPSFQCRDRYQPDCQRWGEAFCRSRVYTKGMKLMQCAQYCRLC